MLKELNRKSLKVGLSMNLKKTKVMLNEQVEIDDEDQQIQVDNNTIEVVDHYIYLGQHISLQNASKEQEIKRRITLGWQAFGKASAIFKNKEFPLVLKRQVYDQCITPTVTYGSETWNLTKKQLLKLRSMQRAHKRIMLGVTWRDHIPSVQIREQTKIRDILKVINKAKWTWMWSELKCDSIPRVAVLTVCRVCAIVWRRFHLTRSSSEAFSCSDLNLLLERRAAGQRRCF
ncbi:uncharacterized protein LOC119575943 [Penaeus monodon]|uniref:uncharacterized protein LOC119575943 n=1 Tax=Penaeus monodon TaxID=6687 RepID=UPI0018A6E4E5|nr:uncharacterized protein LOC119575943 [Penaeus monodon]